MKHFVNHVRRTVLCTFLALFALVSVSSLDAQEEEEMDQQRTWGPDVKAVGQLGEGDRNLGELDFFIPIWQSKRTLIFGDLRGKLTDESSREGNYGAGIRYMLENGWNIGGYGFFDNRESSNDNHFKQATVGVEAMSANWDARINGYLPFDDTVKNEPGEADVSLSGGNLQMNAGKEVALDGADVEIGYRLPITEVDSGMNARVYGGGYYFDASEVDEEVAGPRVRGEFRWDDPLNVLAGSRLTLTAKFQDDDPRGSQAFVGARVMVPLGFADKSRDELSMQERRMTEYVQRDVDIVTQAGAFGDEEDVEVVATGVEVEGATETTELDGSAVNDAGNNGVILLKGGNDGQTSGGITLREGQALVGGGHGLVVEGVDSGQRSTLNAPGSRPTIYGGGGGQDFVLEVDSNTYVGGVDIGPGDVNGIDEAGIQTATSAPGGSVSNIVINDTLVRNVEDEGIHIQESASDVWINNTTVANVEENGIYFEDNGGTDPFTNVRVTNSSVLAADDDGVVFEEPTTDVVYRNNFSRGINDEHLKFEDEVTGVVVEDSRMESNIDSELIDFTDNAANVRIENNKLSGSDGDGIYFDDEMSNVLVADNTLDAIGGDGIEQSDGTDTVSSVTVVGNTINGVEDDAIGFESTNISNLEVSDNRIDGVEEDAIYIDDGDNAVVTNNEISGVGDDGIDFEDASGALVANNTIKNVDSDALFVDNSSSNLTIRNNKIRNAINGDAIFVEAGTSGVTVTDNSIKNVGGQGIDIDSSTDNLTISGNDVINTEDTGIETSGGSSHLVSGNKVVVYDDSEAFDLDASSDLDVLNNTGKAADGDLLLVSGGASDVRIAGNRLLDSAEGADGILITGSATNYEIVNNEIRNVEGIGLDINGSMNNVRIEGNVIRNTRDDGMELGNGSTIQNSVVRNNTIDTVGDGDTWLEINSGAGSDIEVTGNTFDGTGGDTVVEINDGTFTGGTNTNNTPITSSANLCDELGSIAAGSPGFDLVNVDGSTVTCGD